VPAPIRRDEHQGGVPPERYPLGPAVRCDVEIGAEPLLARDAQLEEEGQRLHAEVGVRLQPEAVEIHGVFDPKVGSDEHGAGQRHQHRRHARGLKRLGDLRGDGMVGQHCAGEGSAGFVVQLPPP